MNKYMNMSNWMLTTLCLVAVAGVARGAEGFEQQYDSHAHGAAQLDLVLDGSVLALQLRSPAMNLVGFEHRARTASERKSVEATLKWLHQAEQMIDIDAGAGCTLKHAEVEQGLLDSGGLEKTKRDQAERPETAEHDHHETHAATGAHESAGHGEPERAHTDFEVNYEFLCTAPEKLAIISLAFFARFPGLETVDVRMITPDGQRALTLDSHHIDIGLR